MRPNVDLSMSFESPRLDNSKTSFTAPVTHRKTTLFDYGFCKKNVSILRRSFSTNEATIKAAFEKGKYFLIDSKNYYSVIFFNFIKIPCIISL